jgi:Lrp/AsnC family leucine-responsive transcriptional regulator
MPKISRTQIELDEQKVLAELRKNANENIDVIAKHLGFSRQKVWRTIKRLEQQRLIWGYTVIVDEKKNNLHHYTFLMKRSAAQLMEKVVNTITSRKLEEIVADLGVTIDSSYYVHGEYDWIITFTAGDIIEAKKFCESVYSLYPGVIEKTILLETLFVIKDHHISNPEPNKLKEFL